MSVLFFFSLIFALVLRAPLMAQPITLGLNLLILTLTAAVVVAYNCSAWLGYIVFIIYIGGVLVIFAYVAALTPNLIFSLKRPYILLLPIFSLFFFLNLLINPKAPHVNLLTGTPAQVNEIIGTGLYRISGSPVLIFLGLILLLALIAVVKICHFGTGPLRPFK